MKPSRAADSISQPGALCPCGSGRAFAACCEPVLQQKRAAASAEELMRSRFTAHALRDFEHLHRTYWDTAKKPYVPEPDAPELDWTRLVVHAHEAGSRPDMAFVDFTAYFADEGGEQAIHEKSEFIRSGGRWYYTRAVRSGPAPMKAAGTKVGRNDPCPCGSGKKYKHCCLAKA